MLKTAKNETKAFPTKEDFYYANDITLVWQQVRHGYLKTDPSDSGVTGVISTLYGTAPGSLGNG